MADTKLKILVGYHKPALLLKSDVWVPIHLGRALATQASKDGKMSSDDYQWMLDNMIGDDTGDNISNLNRTFAELTGIYWAWKNYDKLGNPDYIGFSHYRRYFKNEDIIPDINDYDIFAPCPYCHEETVKEQFCSFHEKYFLDEMLLSIKNKSPKIFDFANEFFDGKQQHLCNMFVMKKEHFMEYAEWLFSVLFDLDKKIDYESISAYNQRCPGFCAERLTSLWIENKKNSLKVKEIPYIFKDTNKDWFLPVENKHPEHIPIVMAADDNYTNYTGVCIKSVLENSDKKYNYDFYIIGEGLTNKNKTKLSKIVSTYSNASVYIVNISGLLEFIDKSIFWSAGYYNISTYYRFFISDIFKNFDKVLYIDSDLVVQKDISELYNTDIGNCYVAATQDVYLKVIRKSDKNIEKYVQEKLGLTEKDIYFQAGVLLFNIKAFIKNNIKEKLFDKLREVQKPYIVDQDILNSVLKGNVFYVDGRWNYDWNIENLKINDPDKLVKNLKIDEMNDYLERQRDPYIIHYAGGIKPWDYPDIEMADVWWKYARQTPFYEEFLQKLCSQQKVSEVISSLKLKYTTHRLLSHITFGKISKRQKQCAQNYKKLINHK